MKKIIIGGLAVVLILSLTACGGNQTQPPLNATKEPAPKEPVSNQSSESSSPSTPEKIVPLAEILNANLYDPIIQINDKIVSLPITHEELVSAGAVLNTELSPDYIMDSKGTAFARYVVGIGELNFNAINKSDSRVAYKDSTITGILNTKSQNVFYPNGIKIGSTLSELTAAWGEPNYDATKSTDKVLSYHFVKNPLKAKDFVVSAIGVDSNPLSIDGYSYIVSIDRNTSQVTDIKQKWNTGKSDETATISNQMSFGQEKIKVSYTVPSIMSGANLIFNNMHSSILETANNKYAVILDGNVSGLGMQKITTEQEISAQINTPYSQEKFEIEFLEFRPQQSARILAYIERDGRYMCRAIYMVDERSYTSYESVLVPLDGDVIDEQAIAEFKEYMVTFVNSFSVEAVN